MALVVTLSAVILSTVGVLLGVQVNLGNTFPYISVIMLGTGIVALFGVVVGHNIVLVDTFYHLRREGYAADDGGDPGRGAAVPAGGADDAW